VSTTNPDQAHLALVETYAPLRPRVSGSSEDFTFVLSTADAGSISADAMQHSMTFRASVGPMYRLTANVVKEGTITLRTQRSEERFGPGDVFLAPYDLAYDARWDCFEQALLRIRFETVAEFAAHNTGIDPSEFSFLGSRPITPALAAHCRSVVSFVHRALAGTDPATPHPLLLAETKEVVAAALLGAFPNTTLTAARTRRDGRVGPAALRRAVAYIDAHAGNPITLAEIASHVGVNSRALQRAFVQHRNTTPLGYLRRVRLENAHRDLQRADPTTGASAMQIARRWGFGDARRFFADYHRAYGVPPQRTLAAESAQPDSDAATRIR
jgi:AraC-like DNA-binding protein